MISSVLCWWRARQAVDKEPVCLETHAHNQLGNLFLCTPVQLRSGDKTRQSWVEAQVFFLGANTSISSTAVFLVAGLFYICGAPNCWIPFCFLVSFRRVLVCMRRQMPFFSFSAELLMTSPRCIRGPPTAKQETQSSGGGGGLDRRHWRSLPTGRCFLFGKSSPRPLGSPSNLLFLPEEVSLSSRSEWCDSFSFFLTFGGNVRVCSFNSIFIKSRAATALVVIFVETFLLVTVAAACEAEKDALLLAVSSPLLRGWSGMIEFCVVCVSSRVFGAGLHLFRGGCLMCHPQHRKISVSSLSPSCGGCFR